MTIPPSPTIPTPTPGPLPTEVLEIPSTFVNTYQFSVNANMSRITFGESAAPGASETRFRVAVSMPTSDLKLFALTILETVKSAEETAAQKTL